MGKINMKGGTPSQWASLCDSCAWSHMVKGFRESELVVICTEVNPNISVPFKVQDCTGYLDRNRPSYDAMTKLAINVEPSRRSLAGLGFSATTVEDEDSECEEPVSI
jgi:hypothetical protein